MSGADEESRSLRPKTVDGSFSPFCFLRHVVVRERRSVLGFCLVTLSLAETVECCQSEGDLALVAQKVDKAIHWINLPLG